MAAALLVLGACTAGNGPAVGRGQGQPAHAPAAAGVAVGSVRTLAGMTVPRAVHTATLLRDGTVLVAGGFGVGDDAALASTERYSPAGGRFTRGPRMSTPRLGHSATLLPDGRVLLAGGFGAGGTVLDTAELYDPATGRFTPAGRMGARRADHEAVLLRDGRVLLVGGTGPRFDFLASAELYDPRTSRFSTTGSMAERREGLTATPLRDGRVLVTGGHVGRHEQLEVHRSAELYDPAAGRFTRTGDMTVRRHKHDAVRLADGRALLVGGSDEHDNAGLYHSAELYDPRTGRFQPTGDLRGARYKLRGTSMLLRDGRVLVTGGASGPEVYQSRSGSFAPLAGSLGRAPLFAAAVLLPDGSALLCGGYSLTGPASNTAWLIRP